MRDQAFTSSTNRDSVRQLPKYVFGRENTQGLTRRIFYTHITTSLYLHQPMAGVTGLVFGGEQEFPSLIHHYLLDGKMEHDSLA